MLPLRPLLIYHFVGAHAAWKGCVRLPIHGKGNERKCSNPFSNVVSLPPGNGFSLEDSVTLLYTTLGLRVLLSAMCYFDALFEQEGLKHSPELITIVALNDLGDTKMAYPML
jgi:hypothetical protein